MAKGLVKRPGVYNAAGITTMSAPIVVIGGGPSGLAASVSLLRAGREVICLEAGPEAGGMLRTVRRDGFLAEEGPHSLRLAAGPVRDFLIAEAADAELVEANAAGAKKYVTCGGRPVPAPASPLGAFTTPLLTFPEKLRFAAEPFVPRRREEREETVADFVRRRLGASAWAGLVDAVVGGVYAGDGDALAVRHAFPKLWEFERRHGSLVLGALATAKERRVRGPLRVTGFREGMAALPRSLARRLGGRLRTGSTVTRLARDGDAWIVGWREPDGATRDVSAAGVIVAVPSHAWDSLPLPTGGEALVEAGRAIAYPPVAVVTLGYARERVAHPTDGFGVLSPARERRRALGALFTSSVFPGRAPEGAVSLALFIGGARSPVAARLSPEALVTQARLECEELLGASGAPEFVHVAKWERAIPQYAPGHGARLAAVEEAERAWPGLSFIGNWRGGPALSAALESGIAAAGRRLASI